ncbi:MAG: monovalent cation/H+ antiporter subunit D family protein [Candidatus Latescibacteria bacterium]|nr:monovalent cation/H+ antiporter subunit D family protein [Candidatus Latescibacterota bacterium]
MSSETAILVAMILPLVGMVLVALTGRNPNVRETMTMLTSFATFGVVLTILPDVMAGNQPEIVVATMLPGLSLAFKVEPLGMLFALVASGLWIVTSVYAIGYMRGHHEENQTRFFAFFAFAISAALGVAFARNMFTLFIMYEVLTFSTYPLVTHHRTEDAKRGGRIYMGILVSTSVSFLLLAMVWTWHLTGTLEFTAGGILSGKASEGVVMVLLALYAFGTGKAALMPFHKWLPSAMVAPTPVSALLHAVAVVKAGVFTVMKVVVYIFGTDLISATGLSDFLVYVAGGTILIASLVAMTKDNLKARLAYSTISQLSYIVLGAALANDLGVLGGSLHIVTHAFGKITLFFCAGAIMVALHKTEISDMKGIGRQMPFTMFAFLIGSLSIIGLPPFAGAWSKWYLVLGAMDAHHYVAAGVLLLSSLLNIYYLLPIAINAFFASAPNDDHHHDGLHEAPLLCVVPLLFTATGCLVLFLYPDPVINLLKLIGGSGP